MHVCGGGKHGIQAKFVRKSVMPGTVKKGPGSAGEPEKVTSVINNAAKEKKFKIG